MRLAERVTEVETIRARFRQTVADLQEKLRRKDLGFAGKDERIKELKAALEELSRAGRRQASPFSKGEPKRKPDPKRPGRKSGEHYDRHGHRMVPAGAADKEIDATLPRCCPDCGGEVEHERDAEHWQLDIGELNPEKTLFRVGSGTASAAGNGCRAGTPSRPPTCSVSPGPR